MKTNYSGFVAIVGLPNVGKSTLLNNLLNFHLNIVSDKVHTTRRRLRGVLTEGQYQAVFIDTPGWHESEEAFHKFMMQEVSGSLEDADVVVLVCDAFAMEKDSFPAFNQKLESRFGAKLLKIMTKMDCEREQLYFEKHQLNESGFLNIGSNDPKSLENIKKKIFAKLPEGFFFYDPDSLTDEPVRELAAELVREKVFRLMRQELPYSTAVLCEKFIEAKENKRCEVHLSIVVERDSQKGMVIGKGGLNLKKLGTFARQSIEEMLGEPAVVKIHVKVDKNWTKNEKSMKKYGYQIGKKKKA